MRKNINYRKLLNVIGSLLILEAVFMIIPIITCVIYDEQDWKVFAAIATLTALSGFSLMHIQTTSSRMGKREGYLLTASVWVVFSLFGMLPFIFSDTPTGISSAFFEAMSGFTTTGATTLDISIDDMSRGLVMWQALMQWLGGMGIIIFTLAVIPALNNSGGMLMFNAEATGITHEKIRPRISHTAMTLWGIYIAMTVVLTLLLWIGPMSLFDSICHAFGTVSTGGFSSRAHSINEFHSDYILIVVCVFMLLSGMNFGIVYKAAIGDWRRVRMDDVTRTYIFAIALFTVLFAIGHIMRGSVSNFREVTIYPLFQVVSTITSTGYLSPGFRMWEPFLLALTFIMMFSGGCAGSTSGGAKIDRLIFLKRFLGNEIRKCVHPNAIYSVRVNGVVVNNDLVRKTVAFLCIFMLLIVGGGVVMSFMGLKPVDSFFSAFSCICNTGFGAALTGYGENFTVIPDGAKWVLSFLMLTGRLEVFTILLMFSRSFWK